MVLLLTAIVLYLVAQFGVLAFVYGWVVQADSQDQAGHLAELVLKHNANAKTKNERIIETRKQLVRELRMIYGDYYNRSKVERWWRRNVWESKEMKQRLARVADLKASLKNDETELLRYHVLVRGELHRMENQLPELVEHLRKMLA